MRLQIKGYFLLLAVLLFWASCSNDGEKTADNSHYSMVELVLQLPQNSGSRAVADPGQEVDEAEDWDRLALIFAYSDAETGDKVVVDILSKEEMEALKSYGDNKDIKQYQVLLPKGEAYVYGVTYSHDAANNPESGIKACASKADVEALMISKDYAKAGGITATSKVLSVATGFYQGVKVSTDGKKTQESAEPQSITIPQKQNELLTNLPLMTLSRLATKIDVQWDAKGAFSTSNDHVPYYALSVDGFTYNGGPGRLFPSLCKFTVGTTTSLPAVSENYAYANTDAISQRNGRVYFYVFPDGITPSTSTDDLASAYLSFKITSQKEASDAPKTTTYNFKFADKLLPATWYKVNTKIKGNSKDNETTVLISK